MVPAGTAPPIADSHRASSTNTSVCGTGARAVSGPGAWASAGACTSSQTTGNTEDLIAVVIWRLQVVASEVPLLQCAGRVPRRPGKEWLHLDEGARPANPTGLLPKSNEIGGIYNLTVLTSSPSFGAPPRPSASQVRL